MTELRQRLAEAVRRVLPVDPDDGTVIMGYHQYGDTWIPTWGLADTTIGMIVDAVMGALPEDEAIPPATGLLAARWGCRCPTKDCALRWDVFSDASADPHSTHRVTCITHSLVARSESARVADNQGMRQRAQALYKLDLAHQEQCR